MPRFIVPALVILSALALIPVALVARARVAKSESPRIHLVPDMDQQEKYLAQQRNRAFADDRAMRPVVAGTVARGALMEDDHLWRGRVGGEWVKSYPMPLTGEVLSRGRKQFDIFCATCHGLDGSGQGPTAIRADELQEGTWIPPSSYHQEPTKGRELGHIYNTIANGIRNMPAYGPQIKVEDRWAIVAYVRALMRSQDARIEDVPTDVRSRLR